MTQAAARARAERINIHIIGTYAARRALIGGGIGRRAPAGAARAAMEFCEVKGTAPQAQLYGGSAEVDQPIAPSMSATRRAMPVVLRRMRECDARRVASDRYAHASEKIGSVAGVSAEGAKTDGGAASNDGGATTRILHAGTIRAVERVLAVAGVILSPSARGGAGHRRAITARALMDAICLEGRDIKSILTAAGWSGQRRDVSALTASAELILEGMARALGLVDPQARLEGDETALEFCNAQNNKRDDVSAVT